MTKSFSAAKAEQQQELVEFEVEGEHFSVPRPLPGFILLDFASLSGDGSEALKAYNGFFQQALGDEQYARFRRVCTEHQVPLKADMDDETVQEDELSLLSIAQWVIQETTGRPTEQRSDSPTLQSTNGTPSDTAA